jgi:PAS domain S-box-containing protein
MDKRPTYETLARKIKALEAEKTKREQAEAALRDSKAQYQQLVEDLGNKFVIYSHRLDGTLTYASPGLESIFGLSRKKTVGSDWMKVIDWDHKDLELAGENIRNMVSGNPHKRMTMSFKRPGGELRTIFISPHPIKNSQGEVIGVEGIVEDITERKQAEDLLQKAHDELEQRVDQRTAQLAETVNDLLKAEYRYRTVADYTYDWEYWTQLDGALQYVSPSCKRISGYNPHEFIDNPSLFREIVMPDDQTAWAQHYRDTRNDPGLCEMQFRIRRRDGAVRWIEHACQPVRGEHGELIGFRASNRDITIRKTAEIDLQKAYAEIKELKEQLEADRAYLREEIKLDHDHDYIIGNSDVMKYVLFRAEQIAATDTTVIILGETGTGKELIARAIHNTSDRKERPLIKVNCATLPANLIESELFGHEKGAFTGATEKRIGRFELADGATLFLDEIGELPLELQPKLLRVLQDGEFERLGSSQTIHTDVRIIAATNRDLEEDVRRKLFRMDLWYRLSVFTISMPPLRDRREDIEQLAYFMTGRFEKKLGKHISSIPANVMTHLQEYAWPGNVRELENVLERAVINTSGKNLQLEDTLTPGPSKQAPIEDHSLKSLSDMERNHILLALRKTNWQIHGNEGAAALLDMNPSTLRGRMRKHGIRRPPYKT